MQSHQLKPKHKKKDKKRIARGGKRGTTSGRGTKGQKSRAGHKMRPAIRDLIKKIPKQRGLSKNTFKSLKEIRVKKPIAINIEVLENNFKKGELVNPQILVEKNLIRSVKGKIPKVKLLSTGELTKNFLISNCQVSKSAKEKIEKAGGTIKN